MSHLKRVDHITYAYTQGHLPGKTKIEARTRRGLQPVVRRQLCSKVAAGSASLHGGLALDRRAGRRAHLHDGLRNDG